jgi:hypothetical protein
VLSAPSENRQGFDDLSIYSCGASKEFFVLDQIEFSQVSLVLPELQRPFVFTPSMMQIDRGAGIDRQKKRRLR